jgi:ATP-dependent RNA helicase DHX8/PRP22
MSCALDELEHLSLVSKVSTELDNHLGMNDKVLAEFLIHLHSESTDLESFSAAVKGAAGGDFPKTLIESLDRLMRALKSNSNSKQSVSLKSQNGKIQTGFPGLSIPDDPSRISRLEKVNDTFNSSNNDKLKDDNHHKSSSHKSEKRRDPSPIKELDEKTIVGKVYPGRVTNVKDFGAFVSLNGVKQRAEGLVHISNMQDNRVNHPSDIVQRGDNVYVKVLEINGDRIRLSMKDADQRSGRDLTENDGQGGILSTDMSSSLINSLMSKKTGKKRMTSPERFEIKQLIAAGVVNPKDYPELMNQDLEEDGTSGFVGMELEEEIDIELKEDEPLFLKVFIVFSNF